jgi:hypothetical protein
MSNQNYHEQQAEIVEKIQAGEGKPAEYVRVLTQGEKEVFTSGNVGTDPIDGKVYVYAPLYVGEPENAKNEKDLIVAVGYRAVISGSFVDEVFSYETFILAAQGKNFATIDGDDARAIVRYLRKSHLNVVS